MSNGYRRWQIRLTPIASRVSHEQHQPPSGRDLRVVQPRPVKRPPVQEGCGYVFVVNGDIPCLDDEVFAASQMKRDLRECGTPNEIDVLAGVGKDA